MIRTRKYAVWQDRGCRAEAVEAVLAAFGLSGLDRLRLHGIDAQHTDEEVAPRLRSVLEELGPVARSFGRYVAMRSDLLDTPFWLEFGQIDYREQPADPTEVAAWIERELGSGQRELFQAFEETPIASSFAFQ